MTTGRQTTEDSHRWMVFGIISTIYFFVYFHRVSTSVIAPDLLRAFQTDATALGLMSSMYFYLYGLEQPAVGYLTDRFGARRVVALWSLAAGFGCILFGLAPSIEWAAVGRAVIGFGVGGVWVPAMKAFAQWFRARDFATLTGFFLAIGNLGAVVATTPLAWMAVHWGWRASFLVIGGVTLALALASLIFLREPDQVEPSTRAVPENREEPVDTRSSVLLILVSFRFWIIFFTFFGLFGTFLTFQGLWATPFLMSVFAIPRLEASQLNMLIPVGFIMGAPVAGLLSDRIFKDRAQVLTAMSLAQTLLWSAISFGAGVLGVWGMIPVLLLMGISAGGFATSLWGLIRETTSPSILGLTMGLLNPSPFLGVAAMQVWTGAVMDRVGRIEGNYPPSAYTKAFTLCLLINIACLILFVVSKRFLKGPGRPAGR